MLEPPIVTDALADEVSIDGLCGVHRAG
ncbi:mycofactocin precursor MftA [Streptomyces malaysiensis]